MSARKVEERVADDARSVAVARGQQPGKLSQPHPAFEVVRELDVPQQRRRRTCRDDSRLDVRREPRQEEGAALGRRFHDEPERDPQIGTEEEIVDSPDVSIPGAHTGADDPAAGDRAHRRFRRSTARCSCALFIFERPSIPR